MDSTTVGKKRLKNITVVVPEDLIRKAMRATGQGSAPTVRMTLQAVVAEEAYRGLQSLRGKVKLTKSWQELRGK